jgi:EAL domain-containing protein (putative c-di-GMP-specific phosphodiesterase class I)
LWVLAYVHQFPVDALKIDRAFVNAVADSSEASALIHTFVGLGQALGLSTLAEGIEDRRQLERLRDEQCETGQGYVFARPMSPEDVTVLLTAGLRTARG